MRGAWTGPAAVGKGAAVGAGGSSPLRWIEQRTESFEYLDCPDAPFVPSWNGWDNAPDAAAPGAAAGPGGRADRGTSTQAEKAPELERRLAEETRRSFEAGRARGMEEGRRAERQAREEAVAAERQEKIRQAAALLENFAADREQYFQALEPEVVRLALAVAARILRREAASDPLLLLGAVRAALGQVAGSTQVILRVPAAELELWTEAIALLPKLAVKPAVLPGEALVLGECRIETTLGTVDLAVRTQLAEIERALLGDAATGAGADAATDAAAVAGADAGRFEARPPGRERAAAVTESGR